MSDLSFNVKILADRKIDIRQRKFAGTQGDYKSCTITFDVSEIYNSNTDTDTEFQVEWFGCADTYSKTIPLKVSSSAPKIETVSAEVPQEILDVGGTATVYLNEVKVENGKVTQIICSYPLRLYLGNKATGNNSVAVGEYNRNVTDMYLAVVNAKQDVANYVKSFEETKQGLDNLVDSAEQIKSDIEEGVKDAQASATNAKKTLDEFEEKLKNGEYKGDPGEDGVSVTHEWEGTKLKVTSASGTSSADLKGEKGDTGIQGPKGDAGEAVVRVTKVSKLLEEEKEPGERPQYELTIDDMTQSVHSMVVLCEYVGQSITVSYGEGAYEDSEWYTSDDNKRVEFYTKAVPVPSYYFVSDSSFSVEYSKDVKDYVENLAGNGLKFYDANGEAKLGVDLDEREFEQDSEKISLKFSKSSGLLSGGEGSYQGLRVNIGKGLVINNNNQVEVNVASAGGLKATEGSDPGQGLGVDFDVVATKDYVDESMSGSDVKIIRLEAKHQLESLNTNLYIDYIYKNIFWSCGTMITHPQFENNGLNPNSRYYLKVTPNETQYIEEEALGYSELSYVEYGDILLEVPNLKFIVGTFETDEKGAFKQGSLKEYPYTQLHQDVDNKQDKLTAGNGITIDNNVLSVEIGDVDLSGYAKKDYVDEVANRLHTLQAGLYDDDNNIFMTWEEIKTTYHDAFYEDCISSNGIQSYFSGLDGKLVIGSEITTLGKNAFSECPNLKSVVIPDSVTIIGSYAFKNCGSLKSVTIPKSVSQIGANVFSGCGSVKIYYEGNRERFSDIFISDRELDTSFLRTCNIYYNELQEGDFKSFATTEYVDSEYQKKLTAPKDGGIFISNDTNEIAVKLKTNGGLKVNDTGEPPERGLCVDEEVVAMKEDLVPLDLPRNIRITNYDNSSVTVDFETGNSNYNTVKFDVDLTVDGKFNVYIHKIAVENGFVYGLSTDNPSAVAKVYAFTYKVTNGKLHYLAVGNTVVLDKLVLIETIEINDANVSSIKRSGLNLSALKIICKTKKGTDTFAGRLMVNNNEVVWAYFGTIVSKSSETYTSEAIIDLDNPYVLKGNAVDGSGVPLQDNTNIADKLLATNVIKEFTFGSYLSTQYFTEGTVIKIYGREA